MDQLSAEGGEIALGDDPDWHRSAQALVSGLVSVSTTDQRVQLLETVCHRLGPRLYPAFLHLLRVVDRCADDEARKLVASTLVACLVSGRLPSGKLAAWGSHGLSGDQAFGQMRTLGPIEFVCVWHSRVDSTASIDREQFSELLGCLLRLIATDNRARQLYVQKLRAEIEDPLSGSFSSRTRAALTAMIDAWTADSHSGELVNLYLAALQAESPLHQFAARSLDDLY